MESHDVTVGDAPVSVYPVAQLIQHEHVHVGPEDVWEDAPPVEVVVVDVVGGGVVQYVPVYPLEQEQVPVEVQVP